MVKVYYRGQKEKAGGHIKLAKRITFKDGRGLLTFAWGAGQELP